MVLFKMKVIGLVTVYFVLGKGLQGFEKIYDFTINKITAGTDIRIKDVCAINLIEEAVNEFGSTYIFITDDHYHDRLLQKLQLNFVHSYYTQSDHLINPYLNSFESLVIFRNKLKLKEVIKKKKPFQGTKFLIYVRNYEEVIKTFEILWQNRLVNAVATYLDNMTAYYYTYFPYCSKHCGSVGQPHLLAKCSISTGIFSHREKLFPIKVYNLHKCPVTITITENVPSSYYSETNELTGWEIDLLNGILERVNGVPKYTILKSKKRVYRRDEGYSPLVENSEVGGGLVVSLRSLMKTDFCMYGWSLCATWIVPRKDDNPRSGDFLIKVFPPSVWIWVFIVYFAQAISFTVFFNLHFGTVLFKLFPYILGTSTKTKRVSRRFAGPWILFCLIIISIYESGFQSTLLVPNATKQMSTAREVLESDLKILGVPDVITDALPYFKTRFNLSSRRYRRNRWTSYEDWVYRMTVKKDSAFFGFKEILHYNTDKTELGQKIYIQDQCVVKYLLGFALKKNSHLTETFVKFSNKMNANGFLAYFVRKHLSRESRQHVPKKLTNVVKPLASAECHELPPPINMDKMFVVFLCHAAGLTIASVVFILELMSKWKWRKLKKIILRELQSAWSCSS